MTAPWRDTQPESVRAILDLADDADDAAVARILRTFGAGQFVTAVHNLGETMKLIELLRCDPAAGLHQHYGHEWRHPDPDYAADCLADEMQADALCRAQTVASLIGRRAAA